jgi:hypothetical protein
MVDTVTLRADMKRALSVINPQISGLQDLATIADSAEVRDTVVTASAGKERIREHVRKIIFSLDQIDVSMAALVAAGYPNFKKIEVSDVSLREVNREEKSIEVAVDIFGPITTATSIGIDLGAPVDKPE